MFKYKAIKDQLLESRRAVEHSQARQQSIEAATSIAFVTLVEIGNIDDVTAVEHTSLFSPWAASVAHKVGDIREYEGNLYRCVQAHTSQEDWTPDVSASLWSKVGDPTEEFPAWSQPIGSHDAYAKEDKCSHKGENWISTIDGNVWEPGVYGWEVVE